MSLIDRFIGIYRIITVAIVALLFATTVVVLIAASGGALIVAGGAPEWSFPWIGAIVTVTAVASVVYSLVVYFRLEGVP